MVACVINIFALTNDLGGFFMRLIKAGIVATIIMLFVIIHFIDPTFLPHIWGLLARGDIEETTSFIASFG